MKRLFFLLLLVVMSLCLCPATYAAESFVLALSPISAPAKLKGMDQLYKWTVDFIAKDKRYAVTDKKDDKTTHLLVISVEQGKKGYELVVKGGAITADQDTMTAKVSEKSFDSQAEAAIAKAVRALLDYKPAKTKMLIKIQGSADEGDADGGLVEEPIAKALAAEYDRVPADPYKLPLGPKDIPQLYKGDKKLLKTLGQGSGAELLIVGTVHMPKTKNVGGEAENRYRGVAHARIRVWDMNRGVPLSEASLDLTGEGIFSEMVYSLFNAAGEKGAAEIRKDLGFTEPKPEAKPVKSDKKKPAEDAEEGGETGEE